MDRNKHRINEREGKALVDIFIRLYGWKRDIFLGGFESFNEAGAFLTDCRVEDHANGWDDKYHPVYTVKLNLPELNPLHVTYHDKYNEAGVVWCRLPGVWSLDDAKRFWWGHGRNDEGTFCQHEHDCCGRIYSDDLRIRSNGHSTLLTQSFARNV